MNEKTYKQYTEKLEIICWDLREQKEKLQSQLEQKEKQLNDIKRFVEENLIECEEYSCCGMHPIEKAELLNIIERNNSNE